MAFGENPKGGWIGFSCIRECREETNCSNFVLAAPSSSKCYFCVSELYADWNCLKVRNSRLIVDKYKYSSEEKLTQAFVSLMIVDNIPNGSTRIHCFLFPVRLSVLSKLSSVSEPFW